MLHGVSKNNYQHDLCDSASSNTADHNVTYVLFNVYYNRSLL